LIIELLIISCHPDMADWSEPVSQAFLTPRNLVIPHYFETLASSSGEESISNINMMGDPSRTKAARLQ
jgi:hypothetical protein